MNTRRMHAWSYTRGMTNWKNQQQASFWELSLIANGGLQIVSALGE